MLQTMLHPRCCIRIAIVYAHTHSSHSTEQSKPLSSQSRLLVYIAYNVILLNRGDKIFLCVHFYLVSETTNLIESTTLTTVQLATIQKCAVYANIYYNFKSSVLSVLDSSWNARTFYRVQLFCATSFCLRLFRFIDSSA